MSENQTVPFTEIVLTGKSPIIKVEKTIDEVQRMIFDKSPVVAITAVDGLHYVLPKMIIKFIRSYGKQGN